MEELNENSKKLLDKLYNLRSEDSVILSKVDAEKEKALETKEKTSSLKNILEDKISELEMEENTLASEGRKLKEVLDTISSDDFSSVIKHLDLNFDPDNLKEAINDKLPKSLEKVANEKEETGAKLVAVEDEMNDSIIKIEELGIKKDEVLSDQAKLNELFELSLNSSTSITRDEVTSVLAKMNFSDEEQRQAAKLIMFPEDGLFAYDQKKQNNDEDKVNIINDDNNDIIINNEKEDLINISNIIDINDEISKENNEKESFISIEDTTSSLEPIIEFDKEIPEEDIKFDVDIIKIPEQEEKIILNEKVEENNDIIINEEVKENKKEITKEELIEKLSYFGFDYLNFTNNDFNKILENYDEEIIKENVSIFAEKHIDKDIFNDNIELLYDKEVKDKINTLLSIGKNAKDIYLNPEILIKYNLSELNDAINTLKNSGLEPKNVPLMAY